jgi:small neutral amino acid transporter SnatA (MarC family)
MKTVLNFIFLLACPAALSVFIIAAAKPSKISVLCAGISILVLFISFIALKMAQKIKSK